MTPSPYSSPDIEVLGAREHNLKNFDIRIPSRQLVVFTGLSGSGKSSLAYDTIYKDGQRRYLETFSFYARQYLGGFERPDVDKINGLSPVISIDQRVPFSNPRSTVGTATDIYDFLRLLYARASDAYSYKTGAKMVRYSETQINDLIMQRFSGKEIIMLAPVVKARKGHYREMFQDILRQGFLKVRIDGAIREIIHGMKLDRYKTHDVEIVVDQVTVNPNNCKRIADSLATALKHGKGTLMIMDPEPVWFSRHLMCPITGISYPEPEPNTFSFNSPYGACPSCNGIGRVSQVDIHKIIPHPQRSIREGGIIPLGQYRNTWIFRQIEAIVEKYGYTLDTPLKDISHEGVNVLLYGSDEMYKIKNVSYGDNEKEVISSGYALSFEGIANFMTRQYREAPTDSLQEWARRFMNDVECAECGGTRLRKEALHFRIDGKNIADLVRMDIGALHRWFAGLENRLSERHRLISTEILKEIRQRLRFLLEVGLDYLTLDRHSNTLSGGEAQRIRLATQIGSELVGVTYILDEPSIGLHQRDNNRLIGALKALRDKGNSVLVIEHDQQMITSADYVVDLGPGAGANGGEVIAKGAPSVLRNTLTAQYLRGEKRINLPEKRRRGNGKFLTITGASGNNLSHISIRFPLGTFIGVTGVSGSGKSTLINETIYPILNRHFYRCLIEPLPYQSIDGIEHLDKVVEIDQSPIGRTPRSNAATYTGVFTQIRDLFAELPESRVRGYSPGVFSFNTRGGRCETCQGAGVRNIEMNFLPDVLVQCQACLGNRYSRQTLEVKYKGKSIYDVLNMSVAQAVEFFSALPHITRKLRTMQDIGLGYLRLGQPATTLSGGEAQRVKLATELSRRSTGKTFYILDEPTTGLHFDDVRVLLQVLGKLVDMGNTVVVIEHNMEVLKVADHIIDLGPEGGNCGGRIVCEGTPEEVAEHPESFTGKYLRESLVVRKEVPACW